MNNGVPIGVTTLIFDLGGVLLNLSQPRTYEAFGALSGQPVESMRLLASTNEAFERYELGDLTDAEFRLFLRAALNVAASDSELDQAWNAMLLDFPLERSVTLRALRKHYRLFLLSNTNAIHEACFSRTVEKTTGDQLRSYFDKVYYSHLLRMRKPNLDIYTYVLNENHLRPSECIFFDDSLPNIRSAQEAGLHVRHISDANEFFKELDNRTP